MTEEQKSKIKEKETIPAIILELNKIYDLDNYKLPLMFKNILVNNLEYVVNLMNIPERK